MRTATARAPLYVQLAELSTHDERQEVLAALTVPEPDATTLI
jgi:hypothetical protein